MNKQDTIKALLALLREGGHTVEESLTVDEVPVLLEGCDLVLRTSVDGTCREFLLDEDADPRQAQSIYQHLKRDIANGARSMARERADWAVDMEVLVTRLGPLGHFLGYPLGSASTYVSPCRVTPQGGGFEVSLYCANLEKAEEVIRLLSNGESWA